MEVSTYVTPALPFAAQARASVSLPAAIRSVSSPPPPVAECIPSSVAPLAGLHAGGLLALHAAHGSSLFVNADAHGDGMLGLPLAQAMRQVILTLVTTEGSPVETQGCGGSPEWAHAWLVTCEDIIMAKRDWSSDGSAMGGNILVAGLATEDDDDDDDDDDSDDDSGGTSGSRGASSTGAGGVLDSLVGVAMRGGSRHRLQTQALPAAVQMLALSVWPLQGVGPRWQTKTVATECVRRLLAVCANSSAHAARHLHPAATSAEDSVQSPGYLVHHLRKLVQLSCLVTTATSGRSSCPLLCLQTLGICLLGDVVGTFADTQELPGGDDGSPASPLLLLYQAQLSSAMRSAFSQDGNVPLALHSCAPMASMVACGVSRDPVTARRTIKTLISGGKKAKDDNAGGGSALTSLPPTPPLGSVYQEYVGTCRLAARLTALAELQLATLDCVDAYGWIGASGGAGGAERVVTAMRNALAESLRPHIPVLREHWISMLRDQVSMRPRARAVRARRGSINSGPGGHGEGGTMFVIPTPLNSLLEHNEDSGQVQPVFSALWPQVVQALASLMGTDLWSSQSASAKATVRTVPYKSFDLVFGVALRFLADRRVCQHGMRALFGSSKAQNSANGVQQHHSKHEATAMPAGMRCLHAVRWCVTRGRRESGQDDDDTAYLAHDLVRALVSGLGDPESTPVLPRRSALTAASANIADSPSVADAKGARLAALRLVNSLLAPSKKNQQLNPLTKELRAPDGDEREGDHCLAHMLAEWSMCSLLREIPIVLASSSLRQAGTAAGSDPAPLLHEDNADTLLVAEAVRTFTGVLVHAHPVARRQYAPNAMVMLLSGTRALLRMPDSAASDSGSWFDMQSALRGLASQIISVVAGGDENADDADSTGRNGLETLRAVCRSLLLREPNDTKATASGFSAVLTVLIESGVWSSDGTESLDPYADDGSLALFEELVSSPARPATIRLGTLRHINRAVKSGLGGAPLLATMGPVAVNIAVFDSVSPQSSPLSPSSLALAATAMQTVLLLEARRPGDQSSAQTVGLVLQLLCDVLALLEEDSEDAFADLATTARSAESVAAMGSAAMSLVQAHGPPFKAALTLLSSQQQRALQGCMRAAMDADRKAKEEARHNLQSSNAVGRGDIDPDKHRKKRRKKKKKKKLKL